MHTVSLGAPEFAVITGLLVILANAVVGAAAIRRIRLRVSTRRRSLDVTLTITAPAATPCGPVMSTNSIALWEAP